MPALPVNVTRRGPYPGSLLFFFIMIAALLLSFLAPVQQLDVLEDTIRAATDKTSYEKGAYSAARDLAEMRSAEAMEVRIGLFDEKNDTYRGVYLRDWFFSGYLKASGQEEADLMAKAAASKKQSDWHRVKLLHALERCKATASAKLMLDKAFAKSPPDVRRAWAGAVAAMFAEGRLNDADLKLKKGATLEGLVRQRLFTHLAADGYLLLPSIVDAEVEALYRGIGKSKDAGDRAMIIRALGAHTNAWTALKNAGPQVFSQRDCGPRTAYLETTVENHIYSLASVLITALEEEAKHTPNRFTADIGAALRALTGQGFGDAPELWNKWYTEAGTAWLSEVSSNPKEAAAKLERRDRDTVARFFGLAVETSNVVVVVDGSGSMSMSKLGDLTCASAAASEAGIFLEQLPKESLFQVIVVEEKPVLGFKKLMPATKGNRAKAVKFLDGRPYQGTSALLDALEAATEDPLVDTIILVSDGGSSAGKHQYSGHLLDSAARLHQRTGVRIHSVLVTDSDKHEKFMKTLAESTGGRMIRP